MASEEDHTVYGEEDLDEDDDEESEEEDLTLTNPPDEDDEDVDDEEDSTSSSNLAAGDLPPTASEVTIAVAGVPNGEPTQGVADSLPDPKRQRIEDVSIAIVVEEKKPLALDESRRLFQRLWTDEDEIELLQGFLDYTRSEGRTIRRTIMIRRRSTTRSRVSYSSILTRISWWRS
uniref:Glabrous enhancer-binding protein-like DBD domain-containing protein n=1 Tax=Davidia involucrata TaxID=16924 RepID=A0A5B6ZNW2_DAVIN